MIPLIEKEVVDKYNWLTKEEFLDIIIISQTFPGALAINICTFIGYKINGILGGVLGLLGVALPSFFIIILIAMFFGKFRTIYIIELIFKGINAAVPLLVLIAVVSLSKSINKTYTNIIIIILTIFLVTMFNVSPVIIILISAIYGIITNRKKV
ncbi:chromate transporter [Clostridium faecium]